MYVGANNHSPQRNHRSIRLKGYDYSRRGAYFVTICVHKRACLFGEIVDGEMVLNDAGSVAAKCWHAIPDHFPHVILDTFVVMPNHVHGILFIINASVGAKNFSPLPYDDISQEGFTNRNMAGSRLFYVYRIILVFLSK